jgi:hypothetical protein
MISSSLHNDVPEVFIFIKQIFCDMYLRQWKENTVDLLELL